MGLNPRQWCHSPPPYPPHYRTEVLGIAQARYLCGHALLRCFARLVFDTTKYLVQIHIHRTCTGETVGGDGSDIMPVQLASQPLDSAFA